MVSKLTTNERSIVPHLEKILRNLGIEVINRGDRLAFPCPIHGSDSNESLTVYTEGNTRVGNFICWSHHCEEKIGNSCIDLLKYIIEQKKDIKLSYAQASDMIIDLAGADFSLEPIEVFKPVKEDDSVDITDCPTLEQVKRSLVYPSPYFLRRGFSKEILNKFYVGNCNTKGKEMYMRAVVPVFDISEQFMLGCVGRSVNEKCHKCDKYHYYRSACPTDQFSGFYHKWKNSKGFYTGSYFYGLWKAVEAINNSRTVILVEGQGDIWRLHEAGIENCLGLFGDKITYSQYTILSCLNIENIIIATDSDEAGAEARYRIRGKLQGYNLFDLFWPDKDCGSIPKEIVRRKINNEFSWIF